MLENVKNRQSKKNKRRTVSTFIEKRDMPQLEKICYVSDEKIFCLTMMCSLKKFRKSQTRFSRKCRKISLQSKRISKRRSGRCCIDERRESIQRRKERIFTSRTKVCCILESFIFNGGGLVSRCYRAKLLEGC